jgi:hypothetical protein
LKNNKFILTGLFLTSVISCSNFRPIVLSAYLDPATTTDVDYEDLNFQNALFNQYASGLSFTFRLNYSASTAGPEHRAFGILLSNIGFFTGWTTITSTFSEGACTGLCKTSLINILFGRDFNQSTKKAAAAPYLQLVKYGNNTNLGNDSVNLEIKIKSAITYNVNVGSVYLAQKSNKNANVDNFYTWITFYKDNVVANTFLLSTDTSNIQRDRVYDLSSVITGVNSFDLWYQWVDTPPFANGASITEVYEFNLFTQNSQISIPDDATGNLFGFEFVAVEWWNILGHLQNFAWWIVNQSPLRPLFEWLDTYIISWIRSFIDILTGVFNL